MMASWKVRRAMREKPQARPEFLTTINLNQHVLVGHLMVQGAKAEY
jgi:hypothetical protein